MKGDSARDRDHFCFEGASGCRVGVLYSARDHCLEAASECTCSARDRKNGCHFCVEAASGRRVGVSTVHKWCHFCFEAEKSEC